MNARFFYTVALLLLAGTAVLASCTGTVDAAITTTKDSADFNTKSWEGDVVPPIIYGVDLNDWSVDGGGNYVIVQDGMPGMAGASGAFSAATGWTAEWRMKLDPDNLPSPYAVVGGRAALNLHLADDSTTAGHFQVPAMGLNTAGKFVVFDNADNNTLLYHGGDINEFHTVRLAVEGTGGDNEIKLYVDGLEMITPAGTTNDSYNRQWFGDEGVVVTSGTAIVDYFRYDTTGAFAPVPIPVPIPDPAPGLGHRVLVDRGLQLGALAFPDKTGSFDETRWAESNFTTPDLQYPAYNPVVMPPTPPGIPWSRWLHPENLDQLGFDPSNAELLPAEEPYASNLIRLQLKDEQDITDPAELATLKAAVGSLRAKYPDVVLHTNQGGGQHTVAELQNYMQQVRPDMLMFDTYPYDGNVVGGSPTDLYADLEKYRGLALAGNDGTGTEPIPFGRYIQTFTRESVQNNHIVSESEIRLDQFSTWAFGAKLTDAFFYDSPQEGLGLTPVLFNGNGTGSPTLQFTQVAEANRQSLNLGTALVRLISTDVRMKMGRHLAGVAVANDLPAGVSAWDAAADPYMTSVIATNPGSKNDGLEGDVIVGYFKPLDPSFTNPGFEDDTYFMIVNGLSDAVGTAAETTQDIRLDFDFGVSGLDSLLRLSRDTGMLEQVSLISDGGALYHLDLTLEGGTGELFKFANGGAFVSSVDPTLQWAVDALGDWSAASNWNGAGFYPVSNIEHAIFGGAITSPRTVITDAAVTVKEITFDNVNTYVIAGAGNVTMSSDTSTSTIDVLRGSHQFQAVVNLSNATDVDVAASSSLAFNNSLNLGGNTLTKLGSGTLNINNDLNTGGGSVVVVAGVLSGSGTVAGDLTNTGGTVAPGNSPGVLEIAGDYAQSADGSLLVEIAGTDPGSEFDMLQVDGSAELAGELVVVFIESYQPTLGDNFDILDFGSLIGTFDTVNLPALSGGLAWDASALYSSGSLAVTAVPEPAAASLVVVIMHCLVLCGWRLSRVMGKP